MIFNALQQKDLLFKKREVKLPVPEEIYTIKNPKVKNIKMLFMASLIT